MDCLNINRVLLFHNYSAEIIELTLSCGYVFRNYFNCSQFVTYKMLIFESLSPTYVKSRLLNNGFLVIISRFMGRIRH